MSKRRISKRAFFAESRVRNARTVIFLPESPRAALIKNGSPNIGLICAIFKGKILSNNQEAIVRKKSCRKRGEAKERLAKYKLVEKCLIFTKVKDIWRC